MLFPTDNWLHRPQLSAECSGRIVVVVVVGTARLDVVSPESSQVAGGFDCSCLCSRSCSWSWLWACGPRLRAPASACSWLRAVRRMDARSGVPILFDGLRPV